MTTITVCTKSIAKLKPTITEQTMDLENPPEDVRGLITEVVKASIKAYLTRADNEIVKVLSPDEIEDAAVTGKVSFGVHYPKEHKKVPDIGKATAHALQCFEDGIICIFNGEQRLESPEDKIDIQKPFTFVRLTMLCGRMW